MHVLVDLEQEPLAELKRLTGRDRGQEKGKGGNFYGFSAKQDSGTPRLPVETVP